MALHAEARCARPNIGKNGGVEEGESWVNVGAEDERITLKIFSINRKGLLSESSP